MFFILVASCLLSVVLFCLWSHTVWLFRASQLFVLSVYLQSPSSAQLHLSVLPYYSKACMSNVAVFCLCYCFTLDSFAAVCCVSQDAVNDNSGIVSRDFASRV
jgi:hypothetical protein